MTVSWEYGLHLGRTSFLATWQPCKSLQILTLPLKILHYNMWPSTMLVTNSVSGSITRFLDANGLILNFSDTSRNNDYVGSVCSYVKATSLEEKTKGWQPFLEGQSSLLGTERLVYIKRFLCPSKEQKRKQKRQRLRSRPSIYTFQFVEFLLLLAPGLRAVDQKSRMCPVIIPKQPTM